MPVVALCSAATGTGSAGNGTASVSAGIFAILEVYRMSYPSRVASLVATREVYRISSLQYGLGIAVSPCSPPNVSQFGPSYVRRIAIDSCDMPRLLRPFHVTGWECRTLVWHTRRVSQLSAEPGAIQVAAEKLSLTLNAVGRVLGETPRLVVFDIPSGTCSRLRRETTR